jgi:hypothetical protein
MSKPLPPPADLQSRGAAFWRRIVGEYELSPTEIELLTEVARSLDVVEALSQVTDLRSLAEARQQRLALGRLLAQLQLPSDELEAPTVIRARRAAQARWANHVKRANA